MSRSFDVREGPRHICYSYPLEVPSWKYLYTCSLPVTGEGSIVQTTEKQVEWYPIDSRVIVVAVEGAVKDWAAYIGAVPGKNHREEWCDVRDFGTKLRQEVAELLFPHFKALRWRD